jgi:hypothetical protein
MARFDEKETKRRDQFIDECEIVADVSGCGTLRDNQVEFENFKYSIRRQCLANAGVDTSHLPQMDSYAGKRDFERMEDMFNGHFILDDDDAETIFSGCSDIREKLHRLSELTDSQLAAVCADKKAPTMVKRYATAILFDDTKALNEILNQAMGKPVERIMQVTKKLSPLDNLTEDELRRLISDGN